MSFPLSPSGKASCQRAGSTVLLRGATIFGTQPLTRGSSRLLAQWVEGELIKLVCSVDNLFSFRSEGEKVTYEFELHTPLGSSNMSLRKLLSYIFHWFTSLLQLLIDFMVSCLSTDGRCFSVWQQLHPSYPNHSAFLLSHLHTNWKKLTQRLPGQPLRNHLLWMCQAGNEEEKEAAKVKLMTFLQLL